MSKFGMKIGDKTVYGVVSPDHALELVETVISQYFGEYWTQHKPRCPICDEALADTEKYMNRPVGECTNHKCDSTIHIADFFGKIKDILGEWSLAKDDWKDKVKEELRKEARKSSSSGFVPYQTGASDCGTDSDMGIQYGDDDAVLIIDSETVFVW